MNIVEFVSKFNDVIPYTLKLSIGGAKKKDIKINKELISGFNFKGKMVPFYETRFGKTETKYIPANEIPLPIDIKVECDGLVLFDEERGINHVKDNPITRTRKDGTRHIIRLFNEDGNQFGCIQLKLNASGDIVHRTCSYTNEDFTHKIMYSVDFNAKITRSESTIYTEIDYDNNVETVVQIYQEDGITSGIEIIRRRLQTCEDVMFQSITDLTRNVTDDDTYYYLARTECSSYQDAISKYRRKAWENSVIERDFTDFRKRKEHLEKEKDKPNFNPLYTTRRELIYYADEENDLFYGFVGEYTGNTFVRKGDKLTLVVRTSDEEFNYYTEIDLTGTDPFVATNPLYEEDEDERDFEYFERIRESSKQPKFKTKIVDGEECIVPQNGEFCTKEELAEFERFKGFYLESFGEINEIKVGKLLQK